MPIIAYNYRCGKELSLRTVVSRRLASGLGGFLTLGSIHMLPLSMWNGKSSFIIKVPVLELLTIIIQGLNRALLTPFKINTKYSQWYWGYCYNGFAFWLSVILRCITKTKQITKLKFVKHCLKVLIYSISAPPQSSITMEHVQLKVHKPWFDVFYLFI